MHQSRLFAGVYTSVNEVIKDVKLMCDNCIAYWTANNDPGVIEGAKALFTLFTDLLNKVR